MNPFAFSSDFFAMAYLDQQPRDISDPSRYDFDFGAHAAIAFIRWFSIVEARRLVDHPCRPAARRRSLSSNGERSSVCD